VFFKGFYSQGITMEPTSDKTETIAITINGRMHEFEIGRKPHQVSPNHTLAQTLRTHLGLTGTKVGCDKGACGSCTVLMNDVPVLSCMTLAVECDGAHITTIEGLSKEPETLDPIQQSFVDHTAFQCGFCTPGIIMAAKSLLKTNPSPSETDVKKALSGHFCRCISHYHVVDAVLDAAQKGE
jgi:aerobic-type carbon monoxide dehydrogenase small subunit (CoxS/CutS family)